ncbi:enterobactin transporter EntS [Actinomadura madurae]|uniref:enterobactin transporter EntS n=1 Tax=Actinomadura madurae TaxID=1993 RepID=UPI000D9FAE89|nr:enterobactin transporter EntS [Actinomadura madurae]MCP9947088.1 enterobactin transporter EntS [Actinomadura madurae]MCP9963851.1 enterobactin transporter EntS [Actinomadura madurae]MCP9976326.1 enterobactin transporter EntS [Actinomadura madurae]MCQ0012184.1 enterobactin transporter EntS [Actinomadura madurae]URM92936.1 enterobactin transporter EntS [Actinomadura madurae]
MLRRLVMDIGPLRDSRPFRHVFIARTVSVFGIGMLAVAIPVQVYDMTGSTVHVGGVSAAEGVALLIGFLWGGALADRHDRRRLMLWARTAAGAGFALLALNAFLASPSLPALYGLAAWDGLMTGISITALLAATPALVGPDQLVAAGALNALTVRLGSMASPALGGLVVSAFGVEWNYAAAAAGTLGTIGLLVGLPPLRPAAGEETHANPLRAIADGFRFVASHRVVGSLMLLGLLFMVAGGIPVLMPAFAERSLDGGPTTVGLLFAAPACGAVLASLTSGWAGSSRAPGLALLAASVTGFAALACLGLARHPALAVAILFAYGFVQSIEEIMRYGLIQSHTPDSHLGRVNALWAAQETGGGAIGSLGAGALGRLLAPGAAIVVYGTVSAVLALALALTLTGLRTATLRPEPEPG